MDISIFISVAALIVSIITLYKQSFYKKESVIVNLGSSLLDNDIWHIIVTFTNSGNQPVTIINCKAYSIITKDNEKFVSETPSNTVQNIPSNLQGGQQMNILIDIILSSTPFLKDINLEITYTNSKGELFVDSFCIGRMYKRQLTALFTSHKLEGEILIATL